MEVVASLSQGRTAAVQCSLFTHKSVPVIFEPPCTFHNDQTPTRHELYVQHTYSYFAAKSERGVNPPLTCFKVYYGSLRLLWAWVTCG